MTKDIDMSRQYQSQGNKTRLIQGKSGETKNDGNNEDEEGDGE
jgi:hypothetical protein